MLLLNHLSHIRTARNRMTQLTPEWGTKNGSVCCFTQNNPTVYLAATK